MVFQYEVINKAWLSTHHHARSLKNIMKLITKPLPENFYPVYEEWVAGKIMAVDAAKKCNMPESTFRYKAIAFRNSGQKTDGK